MSSRTVHTAVQQQTRAARKRGVADGLAQCGDRTGAFCERKEATALEAHAQQALTLSEPLTVGIGGEATLPRDHDPEDASAGAYFQETLESPTLVTAKASCGRMQLVLDVGCLEGALDIAETIQARNSLEKMLCHQMAAAHHSALTLLAQSLRRAAQAQPGDPAETVESCRLATTAARLMAAFQEGVQTLARLRTGGRQVVTVQHVEVQSGGQAVVAGEMLTGGRSAGGGACETEGTTVCTAPSRSSGRLHVVGRKRGIRRSATRPLSAGNGAAVCTAAVVQEPHAATRMP